ncbi:MAG: phage virion morphogenesis protein [Alteraurantiacibacter sp.]
MFTVEFNAEEARGAIRKGLDALTDMTPIFTEIGEYLVRSTKQRFQQGVDPDGKDWAPKSEATMERYRRMGYGNRPRPLIGPSGMLSSQILTFPARESVTIGSNMKYAAVMQSGAAKGAFGSDTSGRPIPWGQIPARAWLGISAEDETAIVEIVNENLAATLDPGS